MVPIDSERFPFGQPLPGSLCAADGRTIFPAGRCIEPEGMDMLRSLFTEGVFYGPEWPVDVRPVRPAAVVMAPGVRVDVVRPAPTPAPVQPRLKSA